MQGEEHADVLFAGGHVWTGLDRRDPIDAVAVRGGRIVGAGRAVDLGWARGPRTRVIPLRGRLLLPAFQDAHVHPILAGLEMSQCWLSDGPEVPRAYLRTVAAYMEAHPERRWVEGSGWAMSAFPGGIARAKVLDKVTGDRPAYLETRDGHSAWVNSAALAIAGITAETPDPPLGRIERDEHGAPVGTLHEAAMELVSRCLPVTTATQWEQALLRGQAELQRLGIGAWQEAHADRARQAAYLAVLGRGQLTGRAALALRWDHARGLEQVPELVERRREVAAVEPARLHAAAVKVFQDGVVESRTAAMLAPYLDAAGRPSADRGPSVYHPDVLRDMFVALDAERFAIHTHAIGDRAVRETLDALAAARLANGPRDGRHQIAHLQFIDPADLPRFRALGVIANCQPFWASEDAYVADLTRPFVGDARADRMYPFGSLVRMGATLAIGSDWSVTTPDPMQLLHVALQRTPPERPGLRPLGPAERLTAEVALRAYTRGSALANGMDDTGTIEPGRAADLVVLDRDPLAAPGRSFAEARVLLTMVDGRAVWEDPRLGA
ncbi:MAG: amidohydrolase [Chloroflexota bacterium]